MATSNLSDGSTATRLLSAKGGSSAANAPSVPTVDPLVGQTFGSFRILSLLGEGGMGRVYEAEHVLIGRRAAIKVLAAEIADQGELVSRFFTEARAVNDIRHPNIVEITDFGTFGQQPYIVMELLDGETLEQRLARIHVFDLSSAARVVAQVAAAVGAGHEHGLVHRDIKPANIFLRNHPDYPDFVKVLDFGIAKLVSRDHTVQHHTEVGALIGTPSYMSPEQCLGDTHLDHRSDIYSLGVVLYEMVTGRLPFQATTAGRLIMCHVQETPPRPRELNPAIPAALDTLIVRALAKKPEQRFPSMRQLRDELLQACATGPSTTPATDSSLGVSSTILANAGTMLSTSPAARAPAPPSHAPAPSFRAPAPAAAAPLPPPSPVTHASAFAAVPSQPVATWSQTPAPLVHDPLSQSSVFGSGKSALLDRLIELVRARTEPDADLDLPLMPRSILRCLDLLSAPDFSFGGMATLLTSDAHLAGQIMRVSDSSGPAHTPARSTEQAIARLGTEGVRTALFEIALRPLLENTPLRLQAVCKQPWQHALAVAIVAQRLAHARGAGERILLDAYRAGLFHDAGKPVAAGLLFEIEKQLAIVKGRKVITDELMTLTLDRCQAAAGARLARAWGLSPEASAAVEDAALPPGHGGALGALLRLANALAHKGGFHTRRDELDRSRLLVDEARRAAGIDEETCHRVLGGIKDVVSRRLA
jgi:serine/threonine-protein kinase